MRRLTAFDTDNYHRSLEAFADAKKPRWTKVGSSLVLSGETFAEARINMTPLPSGKFAWVVVDESGITTEGQGSFLEAKQSAEDTLFPKVAGWTEFPGGSFQKDVQHLSLFVALLSSGKWGYDIRDISEPTSVRLDEGFGYATAEEAKAAADAWLSANL